MKADEGAEAKTAGNVAFKAFKLDAAIEHYSAAVAANPDEPVYLANRSAALFEAGQYVASMADIDAVLKQQPDTTLAPKLALRAARCAAWLNDVSAAEHWLAHIAVQNAPPALKTQADAVFKHVAACKMLLTGMLCAAMR